MKFLGIDTSGARLTVVAVNGETKVISDTCTQAHTHSVRLMDEIDGVLRRAHLSLSECEFIACAVGPGSFTGIRIGISTVKGLCFALGIPALSITSLECIAYTETGVKRLALVDAGHGNYYACAFGRENETESPSAFRSAQEVAELIAAGYEPVSAEEVAIGARVVNAAEGLVRAAIAKSKEAGSAKELSALYLRKSSAEEKR